jgi:hypothetical protein
MPDGNEPFNRNAGLKGNGPNPLDPVKWPVWNAESNAERVLRCNIERGLRYENGRVIRPSGRVASCQYIGKDGYHKCMLWSNEHGRASISVHRIICWLVHGPPPFRDSVADHINNDRTDNRPCNLQWLSLAENTNKVRGDLSEVRSAMARGERNSKAKLGEQDVMSMRSMRNRGETYAAIARSFGVSPSTARGACLGHYWKHVPHAHARLAQETSR